MGEAIPPASAAWCFNFKLRITCVARDTIGLSRVVVQFHPNFHYNVYHTTSLTPAELFV